MRGRVNLADLAAAFVCVFRNAESKFSKLIFEHTNLTLSVRAKFTTQNGSKTSRPFSGFAVKFRNLSYHDQYAKAFVGGILIKIQKPVKTLF